jgi:hypothetical protein
MYGPPLAFSAENSGLLFSPAPSCGGALSFCVLRHIINHMQITVDDQAHCRMRLNLELLLSLRHEGDKLVEGINLHDDSPA